MASHGSPRTPLLPPRAYRALGAPRLSWALAAIFLVVLLTFMLLPALSLAIAFLWPYKEQPAAPAAPQSDPPARGIRIGPPAKPTSTELL